ncbi:(2Fe-2S)-binding protein [Ramlibacter sp. AN1015]|uniref:(2Fe-2S)-binding protein n=1 Tax=Ramlibacter sp. AN1015 TaxID=3133428 RepID=UPI0030C44834
MHRRGFLQACTAQATLVHLAAGTPAFAAHEKPRPFERAVLTDATGRQLRASDLQPRVNYVFHYPFEATPVFLLNLGKEVSPQAVTGREKADQYAWPGGVGRRRSIVAYSAICTHKLVYPTRDVSFISFRKSRARRGVQDDLIHCCAEHSQYDPAQGASVVAGPAPEPLAAVLLEHDARDDSLTAYATLGPDRFDLFFERYAAKLQLEVGPTARELVRSQARVLPLDKFCRNSVQC